MNIVEYWHKGKELVSAVDGHVPKEGDDVFIKTKRMTNEHVYKVTNVVHRIHELTDYTSERIFVVLQ